MSNYHAGSIPYNNALYPLLNQVEGPPYQFTDTAVQVFPLKANPVQLEYLVNSYLNEVPKDVAYCVPAAPFVLMMLMSIGQQGQAAVSGGLSFGFTAENQVAFAIPIIRFRQAKNSKKMVPVDQALLMPFIFTSSDIALVTGRTIFGFTNRLGWYSPPSQTWAKNPGTPRRLLEVDADLIPNLWCGKAPQSLSLFSIEESAPANPLRLPFDPQEAPHPLVGAMKCTKDLSGTLLWLSASNILVPSLRLFLRQLLRPKSHIAGLPRTVPEFGIMTLKQFRDAEHQEQACYQALLNTPMAVTWIQNIGLLGGAKVLAGDPSGGFRIRLNLRDAAPILQLLGLKADYYEHGGRDSVPTANYVTKGPQGNTYLESLRNTQANQVPPPYPQVAVLEPTLPFYFRGDLLLGTSRRLCWRLRNSPWLRPKQLVRRDTRRQRSNRGAPKKEPSYYNTSLGPTMGSFTGPFHFSNVTVRILPLKADKKAMQAFCDSYLNVYSRETKSTFSVDEDYVYLIVKSFGSMTSETENVGSWANREIQLLFPAQWTFRGEKSGSVYLTPYSFSDSEIETITGTETNGLSIQLVDIESSESIWMDDTGPAEDQPLLRLWGSFYPSLNLDTFPDDTILLEIIQKYCSPKAHPRKSASGFEGSEPLSDPSLSHSLRRTLFSQRGKGRLVTLKQFRDATLQNDACYQAIVAIRTHLHLQPIQELPPLTVRIHYNPQLPIVDIFGLEVDHSEYTKSTRPNRVWTGERVDCLQAEKPFWTQGSLSSKQNYNLAWRASGHPTWDIPTPDEMPKWLYPSAPNQQEGSDSDPGKEET